ncbi:MAG TPA: DUF2254 domain-containing protein [Planctomycetaceae bacterium]|nr:DUF2254 domain-containing protein [Planctomycetaceae bacterium]
MIRFLSKLHHWWQYARSSFWFVPAVIVLGAVGLATFLIGIDATVDLHFVERWPLLFGAGAAGSRGLLTAVASSMITVAGVVFSITIVALSLTSSQYTSRVLRNFMRDRNNQVVLGVFVGIFAYCLVVLRVIRGGDEGAFVPSLAVLVGLILAFVGIAYLIFFIHYISMSIQSSSIIANAAHETIAGVDQLFPKGLGEDVEDESDADSEESLADQAWVAVPAQRTGYIQSVDKDALLAVARELKTIVRMERGIGEFVVEGASLVSVTDPGGLDEAATDELHAVYVISRYRTAEQDASFGIRQLVDIALKALSPGINDTTTAVMCVDYLEAILFRLASRPIATARRLDEGELRVIARGPSFASLLAEAFDQIRQNAAGNVAVLTRLLGALEIIAGQTANKQRRQLLRQHADLITTLGEESIPSPHDRRQVEEAMLRLSRVLMTEK